MSAKLGTLNTESVVSLSADIDECKNDCKQYTDDKIGEINDILDNINGEVV